MTQSEKYWNKNAVKYNDQEKKEESTYDNYLNRISNYLKKTDTVLDFGCGSGIVSLKLAKNVQTLKAIDTSSELIKIAKENSKEKQIMNINFCNICIYDLDENNESFNCILALYVIHLVDDLKDVIIKMNKLLNPKGLLIITMPCMGEKDQFLSFILFLLSKINIVPPVKAYTSKKIISMLVNNGFDILDQQLIDKQGNQYFIVAKKLVPNN
jgi:2-polyprenyl-3-methyl-5-hydroxy-6-metoxy-1,4-benzoquinol methylase